MSPSAQWPFISPNSIFPVISGLPEKAESAKPRHEITKITDIIKKNRPALFTENTPFKNSLIYIFTGSTDFPAIKLGPSSGKCSYVN
jgi:hypothetical protein